MAREECIFTVLTQNLGSDFSAAWQAAKDLEKSSLDCSDLIESLTNLYDRSNPSLGYAFNQPFRQKRDGLIQRITGGRAHPYFRIGKLTELQRDGITALFS